MKKTQQKIMAQYTLSISFLALSLLTVQGNTPINQNELKLATLQEEVSRLSRENKKLKEALISSNQREQNTRLILSQTNKQVELLSSMSLYEQELDERDGVDGYLEVLSTRVSQLEAVINELKVICSTSQSYVTDPEVRVLVEEKLREVEVALQGRDTRQNTTELKILSIDHESGLLVINRGRKQDVKIGMPLQIKRGNSVIANGMIADVRNDVSGVLLDSRKGQAEIRVRDRVQMLVNYKN